MTKFTFALILAMLFFIIALMTLPHYGVNWDTINHLPRGQAYLNYLLTGKQDFSNKPSFFNEWQNTQEWYWQDPDSLFVKTNIPKSQIPSRSMYEIDALNFQYYISTDGDGHPPLSDILSSVFNQVLFQKLKLINDIDSYRVYGVVLAAALVGLLGWWTSTRFGFFAGIIASLSLALYPLFWSESHFNTEKDIPEAVYWSFMLFCSWQGLHKRSIRWILASGVFFGLALGTKFNIVFSVFVLLPWLLYLFLINRPKSFTGFKRLLVKNSKLIISAVLATFVGIAIFIGSWPYLWMNLDKGIFKMLRFYKVIGTTTSFDSRYIGPFGMNVYPIKWILYTTPLVILVFGLIGTLYSLFRIRSKKDDFLLVVLLWLLVPIIRVIVPGSNIYGGVRQIMEYIPALAIMSGIGAWFIRERIITFLRIRHFKLKSILPSLAIILCFVPIIFKLVQIHPNENAYFNPLIGGLAGAKNKNFLFWGNTFGAGYRQAVSWINKNVESGSQLVYAYELIPNIPRILLRSDINLHNINRSGYLRKGEYAITLVYQGTDNRSYYDMYLNNFIKPVYEAKVDGVSIVKVWKNDEQHLLKPLVEHVLESVKFTTSQSGIRFDLGGIYKLSRLEIDYEDIDCKKLSSGYSQFSINAKDWVRTPGVLPDDWRISLIGEQPSEGHFIEPFVGQQARFIELVLEPTGTCLLSAQRAKVYYFAD